MFSEYVVFVDESGAPTLSNVDRNYPIFVLNFCIFKINDYLTFSTALKKLKFEFFGHDQIIFHERELRLGREPFNIKKEKRDELLRKISKVVKEGKFSIVTVVLDKEKTSIKQEKSVYGYAMQLGLERVYEALSPITRDTKNVFVVEARGKDEDRMLELEFRRTCGGQNKLKQPIPFEILIASKLTNSAGLELSDLIARPVGTTCLHPENENHVYEVIKDKFVTASTCDFKGNGLIHCPEKPKGN